MTTFDVLLDTNVFIKAKYSFNKSSLDYLRKYCENGVACLYTNDIIIREVQKHISSDVSLLAAKAKNAIKNNGELLNAIGQEDFERIQAILLNASTNLLAEFDSYIGDATVLTNADLSAIELFNDYFDLRPPFENRQEKKAEFPDAAIIMSIKHCLSSHEGATLHIVSDDNGWHSALSDCPSAIMYKDLKSLLTAISKGQEELYSQITSFIGEKIPSLEKDVRDWLYGLSWDSAVDENEVYVECDEVTDINVEDVSLILDSVEYIDRREGTAIASFTGMARITIDFSYIDHSCEVYDKEDHEWHNTQYGDGKVRIEIPVSLSTSVFLPHEDEVGFDLDAPDYDALEMDKVLTIDYELEERVDDIRWPDYDVCPDCGQKIGLHNDGGNGFCINCAPNH